MCVKERSSAARVVELIFGKDTMLCDISRWSQSRRFRPIPVGIAIVSIGMLTGASRPNTTITNCPRETSASTNDFEFFPVRMTMS